MRKLLNESEKFYISEHIFKQMEPQMQKVHLFGNMERAVGALKNAIDGNIIFDRENYQARIAHYKGTVPGIEFLCVEARRKDCEEIVKLEVPIRLYTNY
mgnify:CR=1 FL=1